MVQLTITKAIEVAIKFCQENDVQGWPVDQIEGEPSLGSPQVGEPIAHGQVIALSKCLRKHFRGLAAMESPTVAYDLDSLLRSSKVYVEPPKPKKEPTPEYKALMARLREEEETRAYERMMNPPPQWETFSQRFPNASHAPLFPDVSIPEEDEVTYADINRQMALIINVLVSIIACSVAIWMAASHWSTPTRLGLSMGGSGVVGIAEVVVYAGYIRRVKEAKEKEKKKPEVKEIVQTWVIGKDRDDIELEELTKTISPSKGAIPTVRRRAYNKNQET